MLCYVCMHVLNNHDYVDVIVLQIKYAELQRLPPSGKIRTTPNDTFTAYAEIC